MSKSLRQRLGIAVTGLAVASAGLAMTAVVASPASADDEAVSVGNGDFEQPVINSDHFSYTSFTAPSGFVGTNGIGWSVNAGSVDLVNTHVWNDASEDGSGQSLDLSGSEPGAICQSFSTNPGSEYLIEFALSRNGMAGSSSATATVAATDAQGALVFTEDGDPVPNTVTHTGAWSAEDPNWQHNELQFAARESSTKICFASDTGDAFGPALDNVELTKLNSAPEFNLVNPDNGEWLYVGQNAQYDYNCSDLDDEDHPFLSYADYIEAYQAAQEAAEENDEEFDPTGLSYCTATLDEAEDEDAIINDGETINTTTPGTHDIFGYAGDGQAYDVEQSKYTVVPTDGRCAATGASVIGLKVGTVASKPCKTENGTAIDTTKILGTKSPLPILNNQLVVKAGRATSVGGPGLARGTASLAEAKVKVPMLGIDLVVKAVKADVTSQIGEDCAVTTTPTSSVASLTLNGSPRAVGDGPMTLDLIPGLLQVRLNQTIVNPDGTTTQQAVVVDLLGSNTTLDVVIGEATAGIGCVFPGDGRDDRIAYVPPIIVDPPCVECVEPTASAFLSND